MNLAEWTAAVSAELKGAGFDVSEYLGFPLVRPPESHLERVRLLKFKTSAACERTIYAEGMIFMPIGSSAIVRGGR
jgi:hypothetical protein